jgi:predicted TIM-barrel fold metal-dependent hydrolase
MEIIDAQIHRPELLLKFDDVDEATNARIGIESNLSAMDAVGVDAAVIHSDARYCELAAHLYPHRFRGMVDMLDADVADVDGAVAKIKAAPGLVGFRLIPCYPADGPNVARLKAGGYEPWFRAAEHHDVPVVLFLWGHVPEAAKIAAAHPNLRLIVDHFGMAPIPIAPLTPDRLDKLPELLALGRFPNIALKVTGVPVLSLQSYPFVDLREALLRVIDAFGPDRLFWGSDYTRLMMAPDFSRSKPFRTYSDVLAFLKYSTDISHDDRRKILGGSLRKWYGWPSDTPSVETALS